MTGSPLQHHHTPQTKNNANDTPQLIHLNNFQIKTRNTHYTNEICQLNTYKREHT